MAVGTLILIETSSPGNLGAALRVAANFGVSKVELVRPSAKVDHPDVARWACGAEEHLSVRIHDTLEDAATGIRTLVATASGRGRENQPLFTPSEAAEALADRGLADGALVFGSETRGMRREDVDRCDLVIRIPTAENFPVLNLTQAVAILLAHLSFAGKEAFENRPEPASNDRVEGLMNHLHKTLLHIGYLDPQNPQRILRKLRRIFGRAGITENEVSIFRGMCRQIDWAASEGDSPAPDPHPGRFRQK
ncbi:MAG: hypothetical protein K8R59_06490 [Thermoanaerobaculales bacterium]|nr:hypothetical protein [Thermoanaerobaculales bacterium]